MITRNRIETIRYVLEINWADPVARLDALHSLAIVEWELKKAELLEEKR
jgi:hypothetical protein